MSTNSVYVPAGTGTSPIFRSPSVFSVVAAFAPARQIGYCEPREVLMSPSCVKMWPSRPFTRGELYVMVTVLPLTVPVDVSGGLAGGFCCAERLNAAAINTPAHIKARFINNLLRQIPLQNRDFAARPFSHRASRPAKPACAHCDGSQDAV